MAIHDILPIDDKFLTVPTFPVDIEDDAYMHHIRKLVADMFETCRAKGGAGLAANQIGFHDRVFIMNMPEYGLPQMAFINPEIIERSPQTQVRDEGCLSMYGVAVPVERHAKVVVRYVDLNGVTMRFEANGYAAICCQHEIDHLDGKRHIDHVSPLKRMMLMQRWEKVKREAART